MDLHKSTQFFIEEYLKDSDSTPDDFYTDSMELLRGVADEKEIEFDEYFRTRWKDSVDTIVSFDEVYFSDPDRRNLYVFLSAKVDNEIFTSLSFVWENYHHEQLTYEILDGEIQKLLEQGTHF